MQVSNNNPHVRSTGMTNQRRSFSPGPTVEVNRILKEGLRAQHVRESMGNRRAPSVDGWWRTSPGSLAS
jgi:hypothetical protein